MSADVPNSSLSPEQRRELAQTAEVFEMIFEANPADVSALEALTEIYGKPTAGIMKDTVVVPFYGRATVEMEANQPGLTLFHCHIQHHMDFGFKALFRYA